LDISAINGTVVRINTVEIMVNRRNISAIGRRDVSPIDRMDKHHPWNTVSIDVRDIGKRPELKYGEKA